jgi:uncharacterized membrane protein YkvA (DUF1232 family)
MRTQPSFPSERPLPSPASQGHGRRERVGDWSLNSEQVARFDALLHEVHPDAPRVDADRIADLSRWLIALPPDEARNVLDDRLGRIEELRALIADPDWDCSEADSMRIHKLLAYMDQTDNLIPDRIPLVGKLDDVMLLELAWPALAAEVDEYEDFCRYRDSEHPDGDGMARRASWIRDRLAALSLLQHNNRVNASHYAESGRPAATFHIGG